VINLAQALSVTALINDRDVTLYFFSTAMISGNL